MHWKLKATIQNAVSLLPASASYEVYYWIQRRFGGLRGFDPTSRLIAAVETWKRIQEQGYTPLGKVFLEVGTGRVPLVPLAYWLMGAEKTISIDSNRYIKQDLVAESICYICNNKPVVLGVFGDLLDRKRFDELMDFGSNSSPSLPEFFDLCRLDYIAPGDAANTRLADQSIDFHTSFTVFEHIPLFLLGQILEEGNRIIRRGGLFVHNIDYSDHFSHSDKGISAINFLQYSDKEWDSRAGNRYMYVNRLRHDDFIALFESAGHRIVESQPDIDPRSRELLQSGKLHLNERFHSKPEEILSISRAWMITQKDG